MKHNNKIFLITMSAALLASCADENITDFKTDIPADIEKYQYLNKYDALKNYVDRDANPDFKLGSGITVSDFLNLELDYAMTVANFDEVTAGNAQKYNFVVAEDGSMDFARIISFVEVARNAGLTIYGHTLCWHAQQTNNYLNGLIADKTVVTAPGEPQWIQMIEGGDCESDNLSFATCDAVIGGADWEIGRAHV